MYKSNSENSVRGKKDPLNRLPSVVNLFRTRYSIYAYIPDDNETENPGAGGPGNT